MKTAQEQGSRNCRNEYTFRTLIENCSDGMAILGADGRPKYVAPSIERILGYTVEEAMQTDLLSLAHPDDRPRFISLMEESFSNPGIAISGPPAQMLHKDGSRRWIEGTITNMLHDPAINGIVDNFRDVTAKKNAELKMMAANRLYAFISRINKALTHAAGEEDMFREVCRIAVEIGNFKTAWIGRVNEKETAVQLIYGENIAEQEKPLFENLEYTDGGPLDSVIKSCRYFVCNDWEDQPNLNRWRNYAETNRIHSYIILPLVTRGAVKYVLNLYCTETDFFNDEEISLLLEISDEISFTLEALAKERLRKEAEEKLRCSELRLKKSQEVAKLGSWQLNLETRLVYWSEEALRIFGLSQHESVQAMGSWTDFIHPEDAEYVKAIRQKVFETQKEASFHYRILRKDGAIRNLYTTTQYEFDQNGKATDLYGITHDITGACEAEEALQYTTASLHAIFENTVEAFVLLDTDGYLKYFNARAKELLFENTREQVETGKSILAFLDSPVREDYRVIIARVSAGEKIRYDYEYQRKSGEKRWFSFSKTPVFTDGKISAICITGVDITERKNAEAAMAESEFQYRRIVETAQEGIWLLDEINRVTFVNKKMCSLLEYSSTEIIGKENYFFMNEEGRKIAEQAFERRKRGIKESSELQYVTKTGKIIRANVSATPIFDTTGTYTGTLAMISDITEKKNLENLLDKTNKLALIGSYELDLSNNSLYWSEITKEIHEVGRDYVPDRESAIAFYREGISRNALTAAIDRAINTGKSWDLELQVETASGNYRWVRNIGNAEFAGGRCIRLYGSFQDIDARKKAEIKALKAYKEKNFILESISDAFFAVDRNWCVTYWNREAERILGRQKQDIIGKNLWEVYKDAVGTESYRQYTKALKENKPLHFETFYETIEAWLEVSAYPSPAGLSVYFKDITDKKVLQQRLLDEQMSKQQEITKAVVLAQEKERTEIGAELHDNVSQLLAACKLYIKHSLSQSDPRASVLKCEEYLSTAMKEIRKLSHALVGPVNDKAISLVESLDEMFATISAVKNIKFNVAYHGFDEAEMAQDFKLSIYRIIQEQVNNILKYANASVVEIGLKQKADELELAVNDNGNGFDRAIKKDGIGLNNIRSRATVYNGKMNIVSSPGCGCSLTILFKTKAREFARF